MNNKNLAPENIEGTYTLTIVGKTVSITDEKGRTCTANCAPDDTFNLGEGVNLAMNRLHDKTIRVGDIVKVTRPGQCYTTYVSWIEKNVPSIHDAALYHYNESIESDYSYRVLYMGKHITDSAILCYVQLYRTFANGEIDHDSPCYLINTKGLEKI